MRLLPEHLHEQLERWRTRRSGQNNDWLSSSTSPTDEQEEMEPLAMLAHSLQRAAPMQPDARFADLLEVRLQRAAALHFHTHQTKKQEHWDLGHKLVPIRLTWARPRTIGVCLCVLFLFLGVGALVLRSFPLAPQNAQAQVHRVEVTEQAVHTQLLILAGLTDPIHAQAYRNALTKLEQQIDDCAHEVDNVPTGSDWDHAESEFIEVKTDARQALSLFLPNLATPERVITTTELGQLGAPVPTVDSAQLTLIPTKNQITIILHGKGILPGAHLLIDNVEIPVNGVLQNGVFTITIPWATQQSLPQTLGILNTDHTAAQTTVLTVKDEPENDDRGADDSGSHGSDDGSGGGGHRDGGGSGGSGHRGPG